MWICPECKIQLKGKGFHMVKHGQQIWNKGLTKETNASVARNAEKNSALRKGIPTGRATYSPKVLGQERFDEIEKERTKKIGSSMKELWQTEDYRKKVLENRSKPQWSEEARKNAGIQMKEKRAANPEVFLQGAKLGGQTQAGKPKIDTEARKLGRIQASPKKKMYRGPLASNWQGGKSFEEYGDYWTKELKAEIRARDSFLCQDCGMNLEDLWIKNPFFKTFDVHHVDFDKKNGSMENLVTLCRSCHATRHRKAHK